MESPIESSARSVRNEKPTLTVASSDGYPRGVEKFSSKGITLVPQPSDDTKDPLVCTSQLIKFYETTFNADGCH